MFLLLKKFIKEVIIKKIIYIFLINIELGGGIGIEEMLNKLNILALVGGGTLTKFSKNKIIIIKRVFVLTDFISDIDAPILLNKKKIIIIFLSLL